MTCLYCGRRTVPGRRGKGVSCLMIGCVGSVVRGVLGTHLGRLARATGPPFVFTRIDSRRFLVSGAGSTFAKVMTDGRSKVSDTVATVMHRVRQIRGFNFATSRCTHTGTSCLHVLRSTCGRHGGIGGNTCISRCMHRFVSGRPVPNVRGRCTVVGRVIPGLSIRVMGDLVPTLIASDGLMMGMFFPRGRKLGIPSGRRVLTTIGGMGTRALATCRSGISSRPLVSRGPRNKGVAGRRGNPFNSAVLALSGKMHIVLGSASFGTSRVEVETFDPNNDSLFPGSRVVGVGIVGSITDVNNLNGFDGISLRGMLTNGGTDMDTSINNGARKLDKDYSPGSFRALVRLICLSFATPQVSGSTFASFGGHLRTSLTGRRTGPVATLRSALRGTLCVKRPHAVHVGTSVISGVSCAGIVRVCGSHFGSTDSFAFVFMKGVGPRRMRPLVTACLKTLPSIGHGRAFHSGRVSVHRNSCGGVFDGGLRAPGTSMLIVGGNGYTCALGGRVVVDVLSRVLGVVCARDIHRGRNNACKMDTFNDLAGCPGRGTILRVCFSASPTGHTGVASVVLGRLGRFISRKPSTRGLGGMGRFVLGGCGRGTGRGDC